MYTPITGTGDGTAPAVTLTFPFLDNPHVKASVNGVNVAYTWTGGSQITFSAAVANGASWVVYRDTPTAPLVDFTNGSVLTGDDLDRANLQGLYHQEEVDSRIDTAADAASAAANAATSEANAAASAGNSAASATAAANSAAASADSATASDASSTNSANSATDAAVSAANAVVSAAAAQTAESGAEAAQAGTIAALNGTSLSNATLNAATRPLLAALDHSLGIPAVLTEGNRSGLFMPIVGDMSAQVTLDNLNGSYGQGIYVAFASDPTGASGAWRRVFTGPKDFRWFGAVGDGVNDDRIAVNIALKGKGEFWVPKDVNIRSTGGHIVLSDTSIRSAGGTFTFDATGSYGFLFGLGAWNVAGTNASNIRIIGLNFYSNSDVGFMQFIRFENSGAITDRVFINFNTITYDVVTLTGSGDRWFITGSEGNFGGPTWSNVQVIGNTLTGPMQLVANAASAAVSHWQVKNNDIKNAHSNAIFFASVGGQDATHKVSLDDVDISFNQIWSDNYTSIAIVVGLDQDTADRSINITKVRVGYNKINLTAGPVQWGIAIRGGVDMPSYPSVMDGIEVVGNEVYVPNGALALQVYNVPAVTGTATYIKNLTVENNQFLNGEVRLAYVKDATIRGNTVRNRLSFFQTNLDIYSAGNTYSYLQPDGAASFTLHSDNDTFIGRDPSIVAAEYVIDLTTNAGITQTLYLNGPTINSRQANVFNREGAIRAAGAGTLTVEVRDIKTTTSWNDKRYVRSGTGVIYDRTGRERFTAANIDPPVLAANASSAIFTLNNVYGAALGDKVKTGFSQSLQGVEIIAWVDSANVVKFYFHNPAGNPLGSIDLFGNVSVWVESLAA